ncbi:MAG: choice-of-anchor tandem repeat GloVer-containing protein [Luteolibacter sp.]
MNSLNTMLRTGLLESILNKFLLRRAFIGLVTIGALLSATAHGQTPANDNFADAQTITGNSGSIAGSSVGATIEPSEPTVVGGFLGGASIWYDWLAPASGSFTFSLTADFDSQLSVYTGTAVNNLLLIAENDVESAGGDSVTIEAVGGTNYRFRVAGYESATGVLTLNWQLNPSHTMLASFAEGKQGIYPSAGLVLGIDGSYYGTTLAGGSNGQGTVFRIDPDGQIVTLVEFTGAEEGNLGGSPAAALVQGGDGSFYGTTVLGGSDDQGTVFRMSPGGDLTTLVEFTGFSGANPGSNPTGALLQGGDGNLYGTTSEGGANGLGTIFRMTTSGQLTTLVEFSGATGGNPGGMPRAGLVSGADGNFYGTTSSGGANDLGTVFRITPGGQLTTLASFTGNVGGTPGDQPLAGLVLGNDGNLYGTTSKGGANGLGTVFRISLGGQLDSLASFTGIGGAIPGSKPEAGLALGIDGNFYGTTFTGGSGDFGTVFRMTPGGVFTTLVDFTGTVGSNPGALSTATLLTAVDGTFYGTTSEGGANGRGTVFQVTSTGQFTSLAEFTGITNDNRGGLPYAGLFEGTDGNFYGTTLLGGTDSRGTAFRISPSGQISTLFEFSGSGGNSDGGFLFAGLIQGSDGNFYGTTFTGGNSDNGTVFRMTPTGHVTTLVEFSGNTGDKLGSQPKAKLRLGSDGNFYGTTSKGGTNGLGTVFRLTSAGQFTTLVEFTGTTGDRLGSQPESNLIEDSNGDFYGTTSRGGTNDLGTVFRITSGGQFTLLTEFSLFDGAFPSGGLVKGADGSFYGTASVGGANGVGTVFSITSGGQLTVLVEFSGNEGLNLGSQPIAGLILADDGNFYGTTGAGGTDGQGTVFRMTPDGHLTTLVNFTGNAGDSPGGSPRAPLVQGGDGNFYGTTFSGGENGRGTVYRLAPPGLPDITQLPPKPISTTQVNCLCTVVPRGSPTTVSLEYGTDGIAFTNSLSIEPGLTGFQGIVAGRTLTGLNPGTVYYYRFRATNDFGETVSAIQSVSTLSQPVVLSIPATNISPTSAVLNGTVNARNFDSTVVIEWGTDGNSFPNKVSPTPSIVTGNTPIPVSFALGNQQPGQTFFYRVVATNAGGTATSGTQSYRTLIPATATISGATALSTTRAQVTGFVDPKGSNASVSFEYGTDGITFPNSFAAFPSSVSGNSAVEVSATLTGLTQGTSYFFRIRATGPGGTGLSDTSTLSLSILSGLQQVFPDPPPPAEGTVTVNFTPASTGAWRFSGDTEWRNSGVAAVTLATGQRTIEFIPIPGHIRPPSETVDVTSSGNIVLERNYYDTPTLGNGALTVRLKPDALADPGIPQVDRIQWRVIGETAWRNSGDQIAALATGSYLVECKAVTGRETPATTSVSIGKDDAQDITLTYFTANTSVGSPPLPKTFSEVSANEDLPFAYLGQIRTEVGASTGFVVKRRVVATAGHVVFDDGSLSSITNIQWFFQRHTGTHEPRPQVPRGYYLAAGYAAQRIIDNSPGEGSAQSQDLDYAALYFTEEAGRGGYGGYLASDSGDDNEFLISAVEKILAGYPVDGVAAGDVGKLHATAPFTPALTPAFGETWTTTEVRGLGGISGGPLFIRNQGGAYFPAAIYLGGAGQTVVRAIDSSVVDLFFRAEVSGNGGDNNTGGGITHTSVVGNRNASVPGSLKVIIEPAGATSMGAAWQLNPESTQRQGGSQKSGLSPGTYNLTFTPVAGFQAPTTQTVAVTGGQLTTITYTYVDEVAATSLESWRQLHFGEAATNSGDAADNEDPDKDGQSNIEEFAAGTNPNENSDVFKILTAELSTSSFTVTANGKAGRTYVLERNPGFDPAFWTAVTFDGPLDIDGPVNLTDDSPLIGSGFYRLRVSSP